MISDDKTVKIALQKQGSGHWALDTAFDLGKKFCILAKKLQNRKNEKLSAKFVFAKQLWEYQF